MLIVIGSEGDVERKIARGNSGGKVTTPRGVDGLTKSKNSDGIGGDFVIRRFVHIHGCYLVEISEMDWKVGQMTKSVAMVVYKLR
jgi:hypothetical protein